MVSFPPLIDMLKFSGYPYLIRGQSLKMVASWTLDRRWSRVTRIFCCALKPISSRPPMLSRRVPSQRAGQTPNTKQSLRVLNDARTGMPHGIPKGAMCVQRFDDSLNSAIHTTYRISLRSSSMPEPRDPLLKVLIISLFSDVIAITKGLIMSNRQASPPRKRYGTQRWTRVHSKGRSPLILIMILPQVHLRKPCYDFYFL